MGLAAFILFAAVLAGCSDPVFEPIRDSNYHFSVFGYLDASADTQIVRVMPPRRTTFTSPEPSDATVTLEDRDTGTEIVLNDSLTRFHLESPIEGASDLYVHNFWTTEDVRPGTTYRLTAMRPNGESSHVTVAIPEEYTVEVTFPPSTPKDAHVRIEGVEHMGFVNVRHHMPNDCHAWDGIPYYHHESYQPPSDDAGLYETDVSTAIDPLLILPCPVVERDIFVVASGQEWPSGVEFSPIALGVLDQLSNVENAVGFLGGVLTTTIPWEPCRTEPAGEECVIVYGPEAAALEGIVEDGTCGGTLAQARVRLTEILEGAPATVRTTRSNDDGAYRIEALNSGVYALEATHPSLVDGEPNFEAYEDTLTFEEGEGRGLDIGLSRTSGDC